MAEETIPQRILKYVKENAQQGDVTSVINTIDYYCHNFERAINVGDIKGKIMDDIIKECKPKVALELGAYAGYSALRIARAMDKTGKLYTIEVDQAYATVCKEMFSFAGIKDNITLLEGAASEVLPKVREQLCGQGFDFVFLDHWKQYYKPDLILIENLNLLHAGSVVVADNVVYPGCPDYLEYVRQHPQFECTNYPSKLEYSDREDALEKSYNTPLFCLCIFCCISLPVSLVFFLFK